MINIGYLSLVIALCTSLYSAIAFALSANDRNPRILESARNGLLAVTGLVTVSGLVLFYAIITHNFQMEYVASYTSLNTSPAYLFSALWAGNSGSLLFWAWLLSICSAIVVLRKHENGKQLVPYAAMILMFSEAFFLILLVGVTNPFNLLSSIPPDGQGLNPMLENIGMVLHPPALLAGYVIFTVPFAFAISSLLKRKADEEWLTATRRWTIIAWLLLGVGNIIGAWWAYAELGWGGYWAWDPVENAGLMPWLTATAFLHSSVMQRQKGIFKVWNISLVTLTFILVMFGTFLTRSGILSSVHTFSDTGMIPYFTTFISLSLIISLILLYYRYSDLAKTTSTDSIVSREGTFLLTNLLFVGAAFVVLIGTIFPTLSEATTGVKVSLNASFFNNVNGPLFLIIILTIALCTVIGWKRVPIEKLGRSILRPFIAAIVLMIILMVTVTREIPALMAFSVCGFALFSVLGEWLRRTKSRHDAIQENYTKAWWNLISLNNQRYGGYIVHIGILLIAVGVIGSSFYSVEKTATLKPGESLSIQRYTITYEGLTSSETPDKSIVSAKLSVYARGQLVDQMVSEKYFHKSQQQPVTEVAIHSSLKEDIYIILQGWSTSGNTADFKVLVNPLVIWIWIGGGVFLLGGLVAFSRNKRNKLDDMSPIDEAATLTETED